MDSEDMKEGIEYIEDGELEEEKPYKRVLIKIFAVVIVGLLLVYFFTLPPIRSIITGLIDSSILHRNVVFIKGIESAERLIFLNGSYNNLIRIYDENLGKEFKVCLVGNIVKKDYLIYAIHEPKMFFQSGIKVVAEACPADSLVSMHTHPEKHCLPSQQDLDNFEIFKQGNPKGIMAVMCERGRFNFYEK